VCAPVLVAVSLQLMGYSWRSSIYIILVFCALAFSFSYVIVPPNLKEAEVKDGLSLTGFSAKFLRLVSDVDGWLVFICNLGTYSVWSLYDFVGVLSTDLYGITPGEAAQSNIYMSFGSALGLAVAFCASSLLGPSAGRCVHVLQCATAVLALGYLSFPGIEKQHATFEFMLGVVGFGFVAAAYVPYLIYSARSRKDERGFRAAFVDGACQATAVVFSWTYGGLRVSLKAAAAPQIFRIATVAMMLSTVTTGAYYLRIYRQDQAQAYTKGSAENGKDTAAMAEL